MVRGSARTWTQLNAVQQFSPNKKKQNMTTLRLIKSIGRSPSRLALLLIPLVFACFALAPTAQATKPPKPEDRSNGNSAAENVDALNLATTGSENTAHGWSSLFTNDTGSFNTADGFQALFHNLTGFHNLAIGWRALFENTIGFQNTATGAAALHDNTTGINNTAVGAAALFSNQTGRFNTASGFQALAQNTTGEAQYSSTVSIACSITRLAITTRRLDRKH